MKKLFLAFSLLVFCLPGLVAKDKSYYMDWAVRVADSEMHRNPELWRTDFVKKPKWDYTQGLIAKALTQIYLVGNDSKYYDYVHAFADYFVDEKGEILTYKLSDYNIDRVNGGNFLFDMHELTKDPKYLKAIELLRSQLATHPRVSEGAFWHKKVYPHQVWLDGLYMGSPFYARYAKTMNQPELFDDVTLQFKVCDRHTRDPKTGLNYHAWDESKTQRWANPVTGQSPHFWGRSMGWYMMAIVDVLDYLPENHPDRKEMINILKRLSTKLLKYQDRKTSMWYQLPVFPKREGNYLESTSTTMYAYAMAKGANKGYLPKRFKKQAAKVFEGLITHSMEQHDNGTVSITRACSVAGLGGNPYRDGSYEYYISEEVRSNDPKGVGPFILLALELAK